MNHQEQEIEAKFYITDLPGLVHRIEAAGGKIVQPRVFETNLRFDTPELSLSREHRVLRLRRDEIARLTYKGAAQADQTVAVRQEIEFEVSNFDAAQHFLEALGYQVSMVYEKYRTTYSVAQVEVMLDEMPFGNFAEIEAGSPQLIEAAASVLGLRWPARCAASYLELFARLKTHRSLDFKYLTFETFSGKTFTPADMDLQPADII